jgi:hypothetical protein
VVFEAWAEPLTNTGPSHALASRLAGPAIVRFSAGFWKRVELPDVMGCAVRFGTHESARVEPGDQDLVFATIRSLFTLPLGVLTSNPHDYLANTYYGAAPFDAPPLGRVYFRVVPTYATASGGGRNQKLRQAVQREPIELRLEVRAARRDALYEPLARLIVTSASDLDQDELRFDPFNSGRRIAPVGFVHHIRRPAYAMGQLARDAASSDARERPGFPRRRRARRSNNGQPLRVNRPPRDLGKPPLDDL